MTIGSFTSRSKMYWIMMYSTPHILRLLSSVDYLNNQVPKIDGKTPFYDDETIGEEMRSGMKRKNLRDSIHLKDSWSLTFSVRERDNSAIIKLTNSKKDATGRWTIADLLWYGTHDYKIREAAPVFYKNFVYSTVPGVGQTQGRTSRNKHNEISIAAHDNAPMSFYNRYRGTWCYNCRQRKGIRDAVVTSFRQYILLCIENGIRIGLEEMVREGILRANISGVHVKALS